MDWIDLSRGIVGGRLWMR